MIKTFSFKIRYSKRHQQWIESTLGGLRYIYNLAKETKEENYKKGVKLSNYEIQKQFTQCKKERGFEWLREIPSDTSQAILDRLDNSFKSFFKGSGYPKWASKKKWKSVPFKRIKQVSNNTFQLPKLGKIKVFNPKLINGILKTAQIVKEADGYYLKIQAEVEDKKPKHNLGLIGIDRGIKYFAVTSDGEYIDNPKINEKTEKRLRILNRKLSRAKKGSNNRLQIIKQLQKLHLKRKRQRLDFLHKITTNLANQYSEVILEDLNVSKMVSDKKYSNSISDLGWYKFEELLSYKTNVIKVNAKYSSQQCNNCGCISKENRKSQSKFKCVCCGLEMNADEQASKIILKRGRADLSNANVVH